MYGMTPVGVFFTAIFPLVINGQALCQQLHFVQRYRISFFPLKHLPSMRPEDALGDAARLKQHKAE